MGITPDQVVQIWALARALWCILGQTQLPSKCLIQLSWINGYQQIQCWWLCDGQTFHTRELEILLVTSCYRNRDKLRPDDQLSSYAEFTTPLLFYFTCTLHTPCLLNEVGVSCRFGCWWSVSNADDEHWTRSGSLGEPKGTSSNGTTLSSTLIRLKSGLILSCSCPLSKWLTSPVT